MSESLCSKPCDCAFKPSPLLPSVNESDRLTSLLRSNLPPPDTRSVAEAKVEEGLMELARYDEEIRRIEAVLSGLKTDRRRLRDHLERIQSVHRSPIRMVPNEVLAEIMYEAIACRSLDAGDQKLDANRNRWSAADRPFIILSKVCYRWHEVAVGTPKLWAQLAFSTSSYSCKRDLSMVSHSLRRSGSHPLSIHLLNFETSHSSETLFLDLILPHAHRIRHFSGSLSTIGRLTARTQSLEALEGLDLMLPDRQTELERKGWVVPSLKRVCFRSYGHWAHSSLPELPWSQISSFSYSTDDTFRDGELAALPWGDLAPGATFTLFARGIFWSSAIFSNIAELICSISAPGSWNERDRTSLAELFNNLTVPRLHTLRILCPEDHLSSLWSSEAFSGFARRSGFATRLKHLAIEVFVSEDELFAALATLSALETLSLRDMPHARIYPQASIRPTRVPVLITDDFLRRLHLSRLPDPFDDNEVVAELKLVPSLRSLTLTTLAAFWDTALLGYINAQLSFTERHLDSSSSAGRRPFALHIIRVGIPRRDTFEDPAFWGTVHGWMEDGKLEMTYRTMRADVYIEKDPGDIDNLYRIYRWQHNYQALRYEAEKRME
ncbi:F-box domain-containing protein [Mycena kentingensis (nom. inval.)]|nr:F-box domain-containing protein [Mycena kentingensis (nom. inval.)]